MTMFRLDALAIAKFQDETRFSPWLFVKCTRMAQK
jgi:hypothetical protein